MDTTPYTFPWGVPKFLTAIEFVQRQCYIAADGPDQCWKWTGSYRRGWDIPVLNQLQARELLMRLELPQLPSWTVRELIWEMSIGPIKANRDYRRCCDSRGCVQLNHMEEWLQRPRRITKKQGRPTGVTEETREAIRQMYKSGNFSIRYISDHFKLSYGTVYNILEVLRWLPRAIRKSTIPIEDVLRNAGSDDAAANFKRISPGGTKPL